MAEREVWFEYGRDGHRFVANPVHWKGWASLILAAAPPLLFGGMAPWLGHRFGPVVQWTAVSAAWGLSFVIILVLIRTRGRSRYD